MERKGRKKVETKTLRRKKGTEIKTIKSIKKKEKKEHKESTAGHTLKPFRQSWPWLSPGSPSFAAGRDVDIMNALAGFPS